MARYIDAEKIDFRLNLLAGSDGEIYINIEDVEKAIAQTPTADVAKVKHGEWVREFKTKWKRRYFCSVCDHYLLSQPTKFCPNCGAKMDTKG